jgi:hypothetical protein
MTKLAVPLLVFLQMMMNFTVDCVRGHKDGVLLLITADAGARIGAASVLQTYGVLHSLLAQWLWSY